MNFWQHENEKEIRELENIFDPQPSFTTGPFTSRNQMFNFGGTPAAAPAFGLAPAPATVGLFGGGVASAAGGLFGGGGVVVVQP